MQQHPSVGRAAAAAEEEAEERELLGLPAAFGARAAASEDDAMGAPSSISFSLDDAGE